MYMQKFKHPCPIIVFALDHYLNYQIVSVQIQIVEMKKSIHSFDSSREFELPKQWDYLSKRLTEVEKGLTLIEQRHHNLQKQFNIHAHEVTKVQVQLSEQLTNFKEHQWDADRMREIASDAISKLKKDVEDFNSLQFQNFEKQIAISLFDNKSSADSKIKNIFEQSKNYIDKVVFELKELIKKYVKEQSEIEMRIERVSSFDHSPTAMPRSSFSQSVNKNSQNSEKKFFSNEKSITSIKSVNTQNQGMNSNSSTSRVNYLRQKLKQFQKINKKYESNHKAEKPDNIMEKMKNYKDYLEQSESQIEPSQIYGEGEKGRNVGKRSHTNF